MKRLLALFFLIIFFAACNSAGVPDGIIRQDSMIKVLTDIHLIDGYASVNYADSGKLKIAAMYRAVYKKYGTDSVQVRKSLEFYTSHPDKLQAVYEKVNSNLQEMEKAEQQRQEQLQRVQDQRLRDSIRYEELKRDTLNKGFIIDTGPNIPINKYYIPVGGVLKKEKAVKANTVKPDLRKDTLPVQRPVKRFLKQKNTLKKDK